MGSSEMTVTFDYNGSTTGGDLVTVLPITGPYPVHHYIWKICPPIILLLGTVGNALSVAVMLRPKLRQSTSSLYFVALAITDTVALYAGLLRNWVRRVSEYDMLTENKKGSCNLYFMVVYASGHLSSWILVFITLERVVAVIFPLKAKLIFTRRNAMISIAALVVVIMALNLHYVKECPITDEKYFNFRWSYWPWIDFVLISIAPFIILITGNCAILARITASRWQQKKASSANSNSGRQIQVTSMTAMLMTVSLFFLLTTAPYSAFLVGEYGWYTAVEDDPYKTQQLDNIWTILALWSFANYAVNFILYCISGPRFRREFMTMFKLGRVHPETATSMTAPNPTTNAGVA